jgi:hypothetical protein
VEPDGKDCISQVIGKCKVKIVKQILQKVQDQYELTVTKVCTREVCPYTETCCRKQKASFHTCMIRYKYGKTRGTDVHGVALEAAKAAEMEATDGELIEPMTNHVTQVAEAVSQSSQQ